MIFQQYFNKQSLYQLLLQTVCPGSHIRIIQILQVFAYFPSPSLLNGCYWHIIQLLFVCLQLLFGYCLEAGLWHYNHHPCILFIVLYYLYSLVQGFCIGVVLLLCFLLHFLKCLLVFLYCLFKTLPLVSNIMHRSLYHLLPCSQLFLVQDACHQRAVGLPVGAGYWLHVLTRLLVPC